MRAECRDSFNDWTPRTGTVNCWVSSLSYYHDDKERMKENWNARRFTEIFPLLFSLSEKMLLRKYVHLRSQKWRKIQNVSRSAHNNFIVRISVVLLYRYFLTLLSTKKNNIEWFMDSSSTWSNVILFVWIQPLLMPTFISTRSKHFCTCFFRHLLIFIHCYLRYKKASTRKHHVKECIP